MTRREMLTLAPFAAAAVAATTLRPSDNCHGLVDVNRWVADGMLCRRYISPDGNIDLTVRVP